MIIIHKKKVCVECNIAKDAVSSFSKNRNVCKECYCWRSYEYIRTHHGFLVKLLHAAKSNSKKRKGVAAEYSITIQNLYDQWDIQNGLCYYSYLPMITKPNHDWQCSLERKDPNKGYVPDNIVLCCLEFQHRCQWTYDKVNELINNLAIANETTIIDFNFTRKSRTKFKTSYVMIEGVQHITCNKCNLTQPATNFNKNKAADCKSCITKEDKARKTNPRAAMLSLLKDARNNTKKSNNSYDFNIDFEYLFELYHSQTGLCAYSGIPMVFDQCTEKNWTISLERIDVLKGYIKGNVCLVCIEFNTFDNTLRSKTIVQGSSGWNKEKFELFKISIFVHT